MCIYLCCLYDNTYINSSLIENIKQVRNTSNDFDIQEKEFKIAMAYLTGKKWTFAA